MIKQYKKIILISFTGILLFILNLQTIFAKNISGEDIWMEWTRFEYGNMSYGAVANTGNSDEKLNVYGYGKYQFSYKTNLVDFLKYLNSEIFKTWIDLGKGSEKLNDFSYGLQYEFSHFYKNNKEEVERKEDDFIYINYFKPVVNSLKNDGINIIDKRLKGAILSYTMFKIRNNEISQDINNNMYIVNNLQTLYKTNTEDYIKNIYDSLYKEYENNIFLEKRFKSEKEMCLDGIETEYTSLLGEMLVADGESFNNNTIKELSNDTDYFNEFLNNYKFYSASVNEWWDSVRNSVSYKEEFNVDTGYIDFKNETSHGILLDDYSNFIKEKAVFKINDQSIGVNYIPYNTIDEYSNIKFGINNVGQAGSSLACLSMCANHFLGNKSKESLLLPNYIIDLIKEKNNNNYNFYYDSEKRGVRNEIIFDVAKWFNLNANQISSNSIINSLSSGHLIIARVEKCEFTSNGSFVLLTGLKNQDEKNYIKVYDPNIYHANLMNRLFDIDYIVNNCNGKFIEIY